MGISDGLSALSDNSRRQVFEIIVRSPSAVGEIAECMPISRPAVSQHLKILTGAGLIRVTKRGTRRIYSANPRGIEVLRAWINRKWEEALDNLAQDLADDRKKDS